MSVKNKSENSIFMKGRMNIRGYRMQLPKMQKEEIVPSANDLWQQNYRQRI